MEDEGADPELVNLRPAAEPDSLGPRLLDKFLSLLSPEKARLRRLVRALVRTLERLHAVGGVELVEMEESFGHAARVAVQSPVPVVVRLHGPWFLNGAADGVPPNAAFLRRDGAERESLRSAAGVSAPSRDVLERVRRHFDLPLPDAEVIPNPIQMVPAEARWNLEGAEPGRLLFVGRFDRHKGGDIVIRALALLRKQRADVRLWFVGPDRGVRAAPDALERIESFATRELGDDRSALEWLGSLPAARIRELRLRARATVVASRYESFCLAAAEAMAAGSPLVVTAVGALPELIQDERNGLLCPPDDPSALAAALARLMDEDALARRLGAQAALDAQERYAVERVAAATAAFYGRVIARSRSLG
jgi:glycosyltransferase involved in cell wall biosynthesis